MRVFRNASRISTAADGCYLNYALLGGSEPLIVSFFERSQLTLKALGQSFNAKGSYFTLSGSGIRATNIYLGSGTGYEFYAVHVNDGYDPFYNGVVINKELHSKFLVTDRESLYDDFYTFLMTNFNFPLLREWSGKLWQRVQKEYCVSQCGALYTAGEETRAITLPNGRTVRLEDLEVYSVTLTSDALSSYISDMLRRREIVLTDVPQKPLGIGDSMDSYFNTFGSGIVANLSKELKPRIPYEGEVSNFCLNTKRLYPQQIAMVNGVTALLFHSNYAILNEGMGTGKTVQGASICEAFAVEKVMRATGKSLEEIYKDPSLIGYRNIIMCPGHLVEKWAREISLEVPFAKVHILRNFEDLLGVWKRGAKRNGREFYVISKDFAKLSYSEIPVPKKFGKRKDKYRKCSACGREVTAREKCTCDSTNWKVVPVEHSKEPVSGLICPNCNEVLKPASGGKKHDADGNVLTLNPTDFASKNTTNDVCVYCGEPMWQPYVRNYGDNKGCKWKKISHYANKARKCKKTAWVHEDFLTDYLIANDVREDDYSIVKGSGVRRYDPASFIKKHMKSFFDIAIFDEVHTMKAGDSAQGHAMHALVKASKKQLALTGTIAGGCASHLFYLLFRLDPSRMRKEGFTWTGVAKFSEQYGCVEATYEAKQDYRGEYNVNSRGKRLGEPKVMPGISPLVYTKFLNDKAVMLDITDMSSRLPALHENVVLVDAEDEDELLAQREYTRVVDFLKSCARNGGRGMTVLSTMLQFSLSYLDKPYGLSPMLDPITGQVLCVPANFDKFANAANLLSKEKKLVEIVKQEISEGRNCFVYAEYTNSPETCVTKRLRDVLMRYVGLKANEVVILDSTTVPSADREQWIHEKAAEGMKVCIVNPKCTETGLDFCFEHDGRAYNYPSIIFYQLGYQLTVVWQASRRAYRLNQKEECRTYYMAYRGTIQEVVISLIAEKMAATSAIQGKFSAEGLTAMATGVDTRVRLAQALSNMDNETGKELQSMFDVVNTSEDDSADSKYKPMLLYRELVGEEAVTEAVDDILSLFDFVEPDEENIVDAEIVAETEVVAEKESVVAQATENVVVEPNPYPVGSIFNPENARASKKEEVVVLVKPEPIVESETELAVEVIEAVSKEKKPQKAKVEKAKAEKPERIGRYKQLEGQGDLGDLLALLA